jgi:Ca-activated chloride channel family protein
VKAALIAALFALGSTGAGAQDQAQLAQPATPTFHSAAALVALNVTVQDHGSKFVRDLQPADFVVYDDGIKQNVTFFESTRVPLDLILLLDTSASMADKLNLVHEAASGFLQTLRPGDRGAVVTFASDVKVLQPLTDDQGLLQHAVHSTRAAGETCLNTALYIALKEFGTPAQVAGQVRRQAIVVLSDGADTASAVSFDDVVDLARRTGVSIYTVMLQSPMDPRRGADGSRLDDRIAAEAAYTMKTLARETGAQTFSPLPADLKRVYASIATELASQYSIGYIPANVSADGAFHHVNVQVVTRPQMFPRTRLGYIAAAVSPRPLVRALGGR